MPGHILDQPTASGKSPQIDPKTRAIEAYIGASVEAVLRGGLDSSQDGLLFLSSWHEAMPAMVFLDPILNPVDKVVFAVLWIWGRQHGRSSMAFPSYEYLMARCGIHSRSTLSRCLAILRITRWVTLCRKVRDAQGRNRGNIYALHEEPLALGGTVHLDSDFMEFLNKAAQDHHHDRVRRVARAMLNSIRDQMADGEDVLDDSLMTQTDRRLQATTFVLRSAKTTDEESQAYFGFRTARLETLTPARCRNEGPSATAPTDPLQKSNSAPSHRIQISNCKKSNSVRSTQEYRVLTQFQHENEPPASLT